MKFYELSAMQRRQYYLKKGINFVDIDATELDRLDQLSENVVSKITLPLGLVQELIVNEQTYCVPMCTEEPSVVAAANHGAKFFNLAGGTKCICQRQGIYGQIICEINSQFNLVMLQNKLPNIIEAVNQKFDSLIKHGGGLRKIETFVKEDMLYLRTLVDPADAMGANKTNLILEDISQRLQKMTGVSELICAILSNYPSQFVQAKVEIPLQLVGTHLATKIAKLSRIGQVDPYRAVTNNKGIMNGVDAVLLASGNDYRAVEAACGVQASIDGHYTSLSKWQIEENKLIGCLTLPLAIGVVGGSISARKDVQQSFSLLGKVNAQQLANIIASIGLANNFAALYAITSRGINAGHMKLQARNIVAQLEADHNQKKQVLNHMIANQKFTLTDAKQILELIRKQDN
ncbi:MAG: hydroxymethylglutaryl-CoA reductase [Lactobacillus iners]|jgi:hydroxymethylglutaryl-coA reductase, degradative|uniref:hydroxymethylglutaryl-CoA reductase n=1 Tax=Lactobacillus iners TaxID=147802 RepID=UPI0001E99852|nr:hydroxymethylglutaryl-CoA reductase [Lactobacillus iners]EFQ49705.1 hydroxymethylglutaryl-CoA reductase, degradative [Lactobacillus iners LEAF 2062A-h1]EGY58198.1 hydroxymethylglutaryl-CoA reductase, degradative [Lactobacillus iners]MCT7735614.1 hydroxymethylglutaryl-CoA reductase [Lactobacillus iners]MCT7778230.1 hydroxymethylglutaryl-CoA reductase [Lactobacillus iners]MDK8134113.1 hydroxymethylglutaryl-CoA reductase [Lactobacillus iners]